MRRLHSTVLVPATLVAALLSACDDLPTDDSEQASVIVATVVRGPINPVEQEGVPNDAPVHLARVAAMANGDFIRIVASTDASGIARLLVPAGRYRVAVETCPGALIGPAEQNVDVMAGTNVSLHFSCDTGIR